ncbi:MAG: DUF1376 domain-containing protein [Micavibrio sp.]
MKRHTFPLNVGDFSSEILWMNARDIGAFTLLILAHFQEGEDGLPYDTKKLAQIARVSDKVWNGGLSETVLSRFSFKEIPSGKNKGVRIINEFCLDAIKRVNDRSAENRANALKRWGKGNANALPKKCERNPIQRLKTDNRSSVSLPTEGHATLLVPIPSELWKQELKEKLGEGVYQAWIMDLQEVDGVIICPNDFKRAMCQDRFGAEIQLALEAAGVRFKGYRIPD